MTYNLHNYPKSKHITEITCNIDHMCIRHHTYYSVESVTERYPVGPSLSSVCEGGRQVVETWTSHVFVQVIEDRGHPSWWSDTYYRETPTDQYIICNIKGVVRKLVTLTPAKGFTHRTHKWTRVDTIKNTHLKSSCYHTGTTTVTRPKPECDLVMRESHPKPPRDRFFKTRKRNHSTTKRNSVECPWNGSGKMLPNIFVNCVVDSRHNCTCSCTRVVPSSTTN